MRVGKKWIIAAPVAIALASIACGSASVAEPVVRTPSDSTQHEATDRLNEDTLESNRTGSATDEPISDPIDEPAAVLDSPGPNSGGPGSATEEGTGGSTPEETSAPLDPGILSPGTPRVATPTPDDEPRDEPPVELDPRILLSDWSTDFSIHSVPLGEFFSGGPPKDGIRSLENPLFISIEEGGESFVDNEPVIAIEINGDARAYPLGILTQHEIANDVVGGVSVAVTFCPLCNSAIVFDSTFDGVTYEFGVSGVLRNSDLVMYDRTTETWWQQFTGDAVVGELTGAVLDVIPSNLVSWADFKETFPAGRVMSTETGFGRIYGFNPYVGYDSDDSPFLFRGPPDTRLSPIERVVALDLNGDAIAYPYAALEDAHVVHDTVGAEEIVVFFQFGTASALDGRIIADSRDVGAAGVFRPIAGGRELTFSTDGDNIVDDQTGSTWNLLGRANAGPLAGSQLELVEHANHFWFAWAAFKPDTRIYGQ